MSMKRSTLLLWIIGGGGFFVFLFFCLLAFAYYFSMEGSTGLAFSHNQVAVLDLEGTIVDSRDFVGQLKDYGNRPSVQAVVVRINSPGGGVAASQEVYEAIKKFRADSNKKVIVSMASVAASGGYYVACAADRIFANPGSITGSIGVIAQWYNFGDLLRWAKMQDVVIKTGAFKDAGSSTRPLTDSEREYFQSLINSMYDQFVSAVAVSRNMEEDAVRSLADGRVFTGQAALENGLVDELGTYQDAVDAAARMAGIPGEPRILRPVRRSVSFLDLLLGDAQSVLSSNSDRSESHIRFEYLWR
ncbi:MAG: signal peptide peptidase SppA [Acidobacteria bacterium]|nr:signal peptide peptidase SppA [Acidobacteriota bacterium]